MRRTDDVSLWVVTLVFHIETGAQCSTFSTICTQQRQPGQRDLGGTECQWAGRDVIGIDRSASTKSCCLDGRNWQITVFRRENSRFRKRLSKIWLNYDVAVPHMRAIEFGATLYGFGREIRQTLPQQQTSGMRPSSHSEDMPQDVCQH